MTARRLPRAALIRAAIGIAISVAAGALALRSSDPERVAAVLGDATSPWVAVMVGWNVLDVLLRARRWQRLLGPVVAVPYRATAGYLLIGYLANNLLPARLGELVRSHLLGDREGVSRTTVFGTVVVERVIDTTTVVAIGAGSLALLSVTGVFGDSVRVGLALVGLLVAGLAVALAAHRLPGLRTILDGLARWPRLHDLVLRLRAGLAVAGRPRTLAEATGLTVAAWGASVLAFAAAGAAVGGPLSLSQAGFVAATVALATAVPSGPAYLGTFELAATTAGVAIGLPAERAFALGLLVHRWDRRRHLHWREPSPWRRPGERIGDLVGTPARNDGVGSDGAGRSGVTG
ncbi:MAG: membrane protein [Chloroflexota bacterium]|nr:MAG: membrane protein [Chloroflexota bacterium]